MSILYKQQIYEFLMPIIFILYLKFYNNFIKKNILLFYKYNLFYKILY